jgi:glyoxalase family protein
LVRARLGSRGYAVEELPPRFGDPVLGVTDSSGLVIELCATDADAREPWTGADIDIDRGVAVRGVHGVTLTIALSSATIDFMTSTLGFVIEGTDGTRMRLGVGGAAPGHLMDVLDAPDAPEGLNGLGTVHHVAMAVATPEDQQAMRDVLVNLGMHVTQILDRQYFHSIYFREPGGVLFEIATVQPGFLVDEPVADLGRALKLPWWVERDRAGIEAGLAPIVLPY